MALLSNIKKQIGQLVKSPLESNESDLSSFLTFSNLQSETTPKSLYATPLAQTSQGQTFEEIYKTSYSHGLEAIYALENVDLKSVKLLEKTNTVLSLSNEEKIENLNKAHRYELQLDLGDEFRGCIAPFLKREPIHVLGLSKLAEKILLENGKLLLGDLIDSNLKDFVFFKGMGQGHLDEIRQKLSRYIDGRSLSHSEKIDFTSWLRTIISSFDRKKIYVLLESYDLSDLISLSPAENVEVRRLPFEKRQEWIHETVSFLTHADQRMIINSDIKKIVDIFVKPWMRRRSGFATKEELLERIYRMSEKTKLAELILAFFSSVYFENRFPVSEYLIEVSKNLYCVDENSAKTYHYAVEKILSYFYKPFLAYPLEELMKFVEKELSQKWESFPDGFLEKVIKVSPHFRVRKTIQGYLEVKLS